MPDCAVFVSSTSEDLKEYRAAAREAVLAVGLRPAMMEYFAATSREPLRECLGRVAPCAVVVAIIAERYGWVPPDQPGGDSKSITWLECERAVGDGKDLLVFVPDGGVKWPVERTEPYRLTEAFNGGTFTAELPGEVTRNVAKLGEFRAWLGTDRTFQKFTSPDDLKAGVIQALNEWLEEHPACRPVRKPKDPKVYLDWLRSQTATIEIRGLGEGAGKARNFPIEELYIPLTTAGGVDRGAEAPPELKLALHREPMRLEDALTHRRLVIVGDPGSGKTTFLRHVVNVMTRDTSQQPFPIFIRVTELIEHINECAAKTGPGACPEPGSPLWLPHFLNTLNTKYKWGLSGEFFAGKLEGGDAVLLLDGLDEAPNPLERERASRLFETATHKYERSRFVVTTRPQSYEGAAVLAGFHQARIEALTHEAVSTFLDRWCKGVYADNPAKEQEHRKELGEALRLQPEIRRMARNPVMLTALAVVHWNERRLPEQRAELYEAILKWLSRQREKRDREIPERCLALLAELALAMQNHPTGRLVRIPLNGGARAIAREFGGASYEERIRKAAWFLEQETADSGIIVSRGGELQFWHLTFQEYLAALAVAGQLEPEQHRLLLEEGKLYRREWRETALLLAGILHGQGKKKIDGLISAVLEQTGRGLGDRVRAAGLLGGMVSDLRPLRYAPPDGRYQELMDSVLAVFDQEKSKGIEFNERLEAAEALGQAGDPRLRGDNWVRIEGGTFRMGDAPGRTVTVKTFEIGRYPVTVAEYERFIEDDGYPNDRWWGAGQPEERKPPADWEEQAEYATRPITNVSWYEAAAYAAWAGARLPTEAEWEFAARGTEGREYPWGDEAPDVNRANYYDNGPKRLTPVGLYPAGATADGVLDMAGNVWEWVDEWADEKHQARVLRGGSWGNYRNDLGAAERNWNGPEVRVIGIGFRLAREVFFP